MRIFVPVLLFWCFQFMSITFVLGDVGTAGIYYPPFLPTICNGYDSGQFPSSNLFVAAGDGVWDNGAACGRQYLVRCISASIPGICIPERVIQVKVLDYFNNPGVEGLKSAAAGDHTLILSDTAYETIVNITASNGVFINIEFQQI